MTTMESEQTRPARIMTLNFTRTDDVRLHASGRTIDSGHSTDIRPRTPEGKLLTPKQIRARARRRVNREGKRPRGREVVTEQEFLALYKPVEEWDMEELARGRPRDSRGGFAGRKPSWITAEVHERAMEQFQLMVKTEMGAQSITALETVKYLLSNNDEDEKGRPRVPASVKWQVAAFLLEHQVGKPRQHVTQDISVKLQGLLGTVLVNPNDALAPPSQGGVGGNADADSPGFELAHYPGVTLPLGEEEFEVQDEDEEIDLEDM